MSRLPPTPRAQTRALADPDGPSARERLVNHALRLFAGQGFAKTTVREIAEAAQVNIAAIRYYFGDKAGLYRAVFFEPLEAGAQMRPGGTTPAALRPEGSDEATGGRASPPTEPSPLPLPTQLRSLFAGLLAPLREGERARLCIQLHFREMLEPTGLWEEEIEHEIRPMHEALLTSLKAHFGLAQADRELQRLALSIAGLGVHLHVASDVIDRLAPELSVNASTVDDWMEQLIRYALAMVAAESLRRASPDPT